VLKWIRSRLSPSRAASNPPEDAVAARRLGADLTSRGEYPRAIETLRRALALEPRHAATANLLGMAYTLAMRYDEATSCYATALQLDPAMVDAYANAGWNARLLGRPEAQEYFRQWLSRAATAAPVPATRNSLEGVTLCCIDCSYHALAAMALRHSVARCDFAEALFFSDRDCGVDGVRFVPVERIGSSAQYSNFVVHRLHEYVTTDHVLIVQYDGFVLNPSAWRPQFLAYDYIGATIAINRRRLVGNGGFSLRSRKLLRALRDDPEIARYDARRDALSEDLAICQRYRPLLESRYGIRFAPENVADDFAAELKRPTERNFGFHNLIHLVALHQQGFALPENGTDGAVDIIFRAESALGILTAHRQLDLAGNDHFAPRPPQP
jgi:tetratricopeptide (TPR) repeat protein